MANDKKINQGYKADKRSKIILGLVIAVLAIFAIGYFVYISGVLSKVMTGMKVLKVDETGTTTTVENISVLETNFHYYQVVNTYAQQGYLQGIEDVDAVADETTGKTFRQILLDQAASEIMNIVFVNNAALEAGYGDYSAADRVAEMSMEQIEQQAAMYGYNSIETYLTAMYGSGMTSRAYRSFYARQILTNEYEQYVRQFVFTPSREEIEAAYEENPIVYERADFNFYFFAYELDEEGLYVTDEAESQVNIVKRATDSESFAEKCIEALGEEEATLAGFVDDMNPTFCEKYSSSRTDTMVEGLTDMIFGEEAEEGVVKTIEVENGIYVVLLNSVYLDEEAVVSYRTLTVYNEDYDAANAPEVTAAQLETLAATAQGYVAGCTTPMDFMRQVKLHSEVMSEIVYGGFTDNVRESSYEQYYNPETPDATSAERANLGHWLFDESRTLGNTYVYKDPNGQFVTIYFFESNVPSWVYTAQNQLVTAMVNGWSNSIVPAGGNYSIAYDLIRRLSTPL